MTQQTLTQQTVTQLTPPVTPPAITAPRIDLVDPDHAQRHLAMTSPDLLALINRGDLAAYRFGDDVRFRRHDIEVLALTRRGPVASE